jgi:hypothetical protein
VNASVISLVLLIVPNFALANIVPAEALPE